MPGRGFKYIGYSSVEIHDEVLFAPGGQVNNWARKVAAAQTRNTKKAAPVNKRTRKFPGDTPVGWLKSQIGSGVSMDGPKVIGIETWSNADYTIYVIKGTNAQIFRDNLGRFAKGGFPLPYNNYGRFKKVRIIRGQKANNFFLKGLTATARTHPSLGGKSFRMLNN